MSCPTCGPHSSGAVVRDHLSGSWTAAEETPPGDHAKRRVAIGADTVELLRAHRLAQAKDALAYGPPWPLTLIEAFIPGILSVIAKATTQVLSSSFGG